MAYIFIKINAQNNIRKTNNISFFFYLVRTRFPSFTPTIQNTEKTVLKDCSKMNSQADKN